MPKIVKTQLELADLEPGLLIDEHALEQACAQHPDLFYRVSKRLADEISMRDALKDLLATTEAQVDAEIREEARDAEAEAEEIATKLGTKSKGKKGVTEREVESLKQLDTRVAKVRKQLLEAGHAVGSWTALKEAFTQRSYMLKTLGELYVSNYYSDPSTTGASNANAQADRAKRAMQEERVRRR